MKEREINRILKKMVTDNGEQVTKMKSLIDSTQTLKKEENFKNN
jgi:hypothetical protein